MIHVSWRGRDSGLGVSAALALLVCSGSAQATIETVEVSPRFPTPTDDVLVRVSGNFPDSCWVFKGRDLQLSGNEVKVEVLTEVTGGPCLDVLVPYSFEASLGRLDAGSYTVQVVDPQEKESVEFLVKARTELLPGDANSDGSTDISDAVYTLLFLFAGGKAPPCERQADANDDGTVDASDPIFLLTYLFMGGSAPHALSARCYADEHCVLLDWLVFCVGHWDCECGECVAKCELDECGDGVCDVAGGESAQSCPGDCKESNCPPVCGAIGTRSEGWYNSCTGELLRWDQCAFCDPVCRACGSKSEGWYDSCTGDLIAWGDCDCEE
jgi:hypothetical protein